MYIHWKIMCSISYLFKIFSTHRFEFHINSKSLHAKKCLSGITTISTRPQSHPKKSFFRVPKINRHARLPKSSLPNDSLSADFLLRDKAKFADKVRLGFARNLHGHIECDYQMLRARRMFMNE